jgi:hypothetical protein
MYLYHVTENNNIKLIYKDNMLNASNWSEGWRDEKKAFKINHVLLVAEDANILKHTNGHQHIFKICAWLDVNIATSEQGSYNSISIAQSSILRICHDDMIGSGFNWTIDDKASHKQQHGVAYLYWCKEFSTSRLSSTGLPLANIEILFGGKWTPITQGVLRELP